MPLRDTTLASCRRLVLLAFCIFNLAAGLAAQTTRGYLGAELQDLPPQQLAALKVTHGVEVINLDEKGPAAKAGVKPQDVILAVDGQPVEDMQQIRLLVQQNPNGTVALNILRGGDKLTLHVRLGGNEISVEREAKEHADAFGRVAFARCDDPSGTYCIGPFPENRLSCTNTFIKPMRQPTTCELVLQVHATKEPPFDFDGSSNLPPADLAQGVQWKGSIRIWADKARYRYKADDQWLPWSEWQIERDPNGRPTLMVAGLQKQNGQWLAADLRVTDLMMFHNQTVPANPLDYFDRATNETMREGGQLFRPVPFDELVSSIKQPECDEIFSGKRQAQPSPVQALSKRTFAGTVDEFAAVLPQFVEQAAYATHSDPTIYDKEIAFITDAVRTCSHITPDMYTSALRASAAKRKRLDLGDYYGEQYRVCNRGATMVSQQVGHALAPGQRGIQLEFVLGVFTDSAHHPIFQTVVSFGRLPGDSFSNVAFENYGIVSASVEVAASDTSSEMKSGH